MERTNYVDRAKKLLIKTALVVVPLAAAVPAAEAGPVSLPFTGTPDCQTMMSGSATVGSCVGSVFSAQISGSAINGVSFSTGSGGITFSALASGGADAVTMADGGTLSGGTLSGSLPVSWDFNISSGSFTGWLVSFYLGSTEGGADYGSAQFSGSLASVTSAHITGSGSMTLLKTPISGTVVETVGLEVFVNSGSGLFLSFPLNYGPVDAATTPEPATPGFIGAGFGLMGWLLRRRRKKA